MHLSPYALIEKCMCLALVTEGEIPRASLKADRAPDTSRRCNVDVGTYSGFKHLSTQLLTPCRQTRQCKQRGRSGAGGPEYLLTTDGVMQTCCCEETNMCLQQLTVSIHVIFRECSSVLPVDATCDGVSSVVASLQTQHLKWVRLFLKRPLVGLRVGGRSWAGGMSSGFPPLTCQQESVMVKGRNT